MPPEKLLNCPFCGSEKIAEDEYGFVDCCHCGASSHGVVQWNTRTPTPELVELRKDKERLDWIDWHSFTNREGEKEIHFNYTGTLRDAIDEATKEK